MMGGTLAPGASIESLDAVAALTLNSGSTFKWEYSSGGGLPADNAVLVGADVMNVGGTLNIASAMLSGANLGTAFMANPSKFVLLSYAGAPTTSVGQFAGRPNMSNVFLAGRSWIIRYDDTAAGSLNAASALHTSAVTLTSIPEASSIFVIGLGGIFAAAAIWLGKRRGFDLLHI
jgi:hypothetical protein